MKKCIFCLCDKELTMEHIVPEALGNRNLKIYDVCKDCNSKLGQTIDAKFINSDYFGFIRAIENIKGKNGNIEYRKKVIDENGTLYNSINLSKFSKIPHIKEDENKITASCSSKEEGSAMLRKNLSRKGYTEEQINNKIDSMTVKKTNHNEFTVDFEIDIVDIELELLKIVYEFLYKLIGVKFIESKEGDRIRKILLRAMNKEIINYEEIINYFLPYKIQLSSLVKAANIEGMEYKVVIVTFSDEQKIYVFIDLLGFEASIVIPNELKIQILEEICFI